jgi:parallel beta-helix repeat protein
MNNSIYNYARWKRTYMPGIKFNGVGTHAKYNEVFNAPHQGVSGIGNEHLIESNYLHDLCYEVTDSGAFYVGRSWSNRGNKLINNVFENIRKTEETALGTPQVNGVYLDDQMSGWEVINNTFINAEQGVLIGGGRHNTVEGNSFTGCDIAVVMDARGLTWENTSCPPGGSLEQDLESFNYQENPWASRYPEVVNIYSDQPCTPIHNSIQNNQYCDVGAFSEFYDGAYDTNTIANNEVAEDCDDDIMKKREPKGGVA